MKLTKELIESGKLNVKKTSRQDILDFVAEVYPAIIPFAEGDTKVDMLNKILDHIEVVDATQEPEQPLDEVEPPKRQRLGGYWDLGYRENGEHICPTWDGSPDKGSNALNNGEA